MNRDRSRSPSPENKRLRLRRRIGIGGVQEAEAMAAPQSGEAVPELQNPLSLSSSEVNRDIKSLLCNAVEKYLNKTIPGETVDEKLEYITAIVKSSPPLEQPSRNNRFMVMQVICLEDMKLSLGNMREETPFLMTYDPPGEFNLPKSLQASSTGSHRKALEVYQEIVRKMLILLGASQYRAIGKDLIGSLFERMYQTRKSYLDTLWVHAGNVHTTDSKKVMLYRSDFGANSTDYLAIKEATDDQVEGANKEAEYQRLKTHGLVYSVAEYEALEADPLKYDIFLRSGRVHVRDALMDKFGLLYWAATSFRKNKADYNTIWYWHEEDALDPFAFDSPSLQIVTDQGVPNFEGIEEKVFRMYSRIIFWALEFLDCVGTRVIAQEHLERMIKRCYITFEPFLPATFFKYATYAGGELLLSCLDEDGKGKLGLKESAQARVLVRVATGHGEGAGDTFYSITV